MMDAKLVAEITGNLIAEYRAIRGDLYRDLKAEGIDISTTPLAALPTGYRIRWERVNGLAARVNDHLEILSGGIDVAEMQRIREASDYREIVKRYAV